MIIGACSLFYRILRSYSYFEFNGTNHIKMYWQLGGNLEPVQMICEVDWKECPRAIANYIWSEIVTDVLDCLTNEGILWRIFAVLLVFFILLRVIYLKMRRLKGTKLNKEILSKVTYKVEDLELKVNILTYKMQYGSWPLPHQIQRSDFKKKIRNIRLTLSNPSDRNDWIKHILLSPGKNDSCTSYIKCNHPSSHRLTKLFDAKKTSLHPYFQRDVLSTEYSSTKSSKSSSNRSLKMSSACMEKEDRKKRKVSKSENLEVQHQNTVPLHILPRRNSTRKFTKTMDECKWYLRELQNSNKNLGLICSSSELSDTSTIKDVMSETQPRAYRRSKHLTSRKRIIEENYDEKKRADDPNIGTEVDETNMERRDNTNYLSISNTNNSPVLKLIDEGLLPSKLDITFCRDILSQQSLTNVLVPPSRRFNNIMHTSEETLYEVRKKLKSLYKVLRSYEVQNSKIQAIEGQNDNGKKVQDICQNVVDTLVSITTDIENLNENKRSTIYFDAVTKTTDKETPLTGLNNYEQCETDETYKSSEVSVQSCCNVLAIYHDGTSNFHKTGVLKNTEVVDPLTSGKYEKIPERIYYTLSTESAEEENNEEERMTIQSEQFRDKSSMEEEGKQSTCDDQPIPMDTEEDLIMTPTSSHTEISKDSESDDKTMTFLLQEALEFKKALLTRVELEKSCSVYEITPEDFKSKPPLEQTGWSHISDNLQSKLLDIITEEQSVSSSTERTSRTYMLFNVKQEDTFVDSNENGKGYEDIRKEFSNSNNILCSPSEYFSFSNIIHDNDNIKINELCLPQQLWIERNKSTEMEVNNLKTRYMSANGLERISDNKLVDIKSDNCLNNTQINRYEEFEKRKDMSESLRAMKVEEIGNVEDTITKTFDVFLENENKTASASMNKDKNEKKIDDLRMQPSIIPDIKNSESLLAKENSYTLNDATYNKDLEILRYNPNLLLKRHPGLCSLIEQTSCATNIGKEQDMQKMFENTETAFDSASPSESKDNSVETNLTPDVNHSNSNIFEMHSATNFVGKLVEEKKSDLKWHDNYVSNEENDQTPSGNTITLRKTNTAEETMYNEDGTSVEKHKVIEASPSGNEHLQNIKNISSTENYFTNHGNGDNNADLTKSYLNLVSPHSSLYFTDEASSSSAKFNNALYENLDDQLNSNNIREAIVKNSDNTQQYKIKDVNQFTEDNEPRLCTSDKYANINNNSDTRINSEEIHVEILDEENILKEILSTSVKDNKNVTNEELVKMQPKKIETNIQSTFNNINLSNKTISCTDINNRIHSSDLSFNKPTRNNTDVTIVREKMLYCNDSADSLQENASSKMTSTGKRQRNDISTPDIMKASLEIEKYKNVKSDVLHIGHSKARNISLTDGRTRDLSVDSRCSTGSNNNNIFKKRSRSQINLRSKGSTSHYVVTLPAESTLTISNPKSPSRSFVPTPKGSSKSCIPILRSRLEAARKTENETRPKSPMRSPLTMTMLWKDNFYKNRNVSEEIVQVEGIVQSKSQYLEVINNSVEKTNDESNCIVRNINETSLNGNNISKEQMVIYVNIFTKYNQHTTKIVNPNKFLTYVDNKDKVDPNTHDEKQLTLESKSDRKLPVSETEKEGNTLCKIVTVVSSVINGNDLNENKLMDPSISKTKSTLSTNVLLNDRLKNLCFLTVEQKEVDVTAKPSVTDTSTSISDLQSISETSENPLSKFQIYGIPKELNNDEYITLLEILNQEHNCVHLEELRNLCKEVVSDHEKYK